MEWFRKISINYLIILFGIIIYLFHFTERDPSSPYERPIISDAKGYYAYLPAIFIYQDFEYDFIEEMDQKYYALGVDKQIKGDESTYRNYNFNKYAKVNEWKSIQLKYDVPVTRDTLVIYFWNKDPHQRAYFDNVKVGFYSIK